MRISVLIFAVFTAVAFATAQAADAPQKTFDLVIVHGAVPAPQRLLKVEKGDVLRVRITSDAPGELHVHGYRLSVKLLPGQPGELAFTAYATGRYPIEWHDAAATTASRHRSAPLATLEVRPR